MWINVFVFLQSDVVHQSVFELIHTDDRALFRRQLHFALNPNSSQQDGGDSLSEQRGGAYPPNHLQISVIFSECCD